MKGRSIDHVDRASHGTHILGFALGSLPAFGAGLIGDHVDLGGRALGLLEVVDCSVQPVTQDRNER